MADETDTPAATSGPEQMIADAVGDLKAFCDAMRADFAGLKGRMDSMEAGRTDSSDTIVPAVETPVDVPAIDVAPAATEALAPGNDAPGDVALDVTPTELAADAGDLDMAAMADSIARATGPLRADIDRLSRLIPAELTIEQRQQFATAQEQAEQAFQSFGDHAPAPMQGESIGTYKRRLAAKMQPHSAKWKGTKLTSIADDATLDVIVADIYSDAAAVARKGSDVTPGQLQAVRRRTDAGHTVIEYRGSPGSWMKPLAGATRRATGRFNTGR